MFANVAELHLYHSEVAVDDVMQKLGGFHAFSSDLASSLSDQIGKHNDYPSRVNPLLTVATDVTISLQNVHTHVGLTLTP